MDKVKLDIKETSKRKRGQPPKPPELKRVQVNFRILPELKAKLKEVDNQNKLIETLLIEYFNSQASD